MGAPNALFMLTSVSHYFTTYASLNDVSALRRHIKGGRHVIVTDVKHVLFVHKQTHFFLNCTHLFTMGEKIHKSIVNLSDFNLNEHHISLLSRGLKFCPTQGPPNAGELREDMDRVHRRLRQIAFFDNPENDTPSTGDTQAVLSLPDYLGDNITSTSPFKHRKFKLPATGKGPRPPKTLRP